MRSATELLHEAKEHYEGDLNKFLSFLEQKRATCEAEQRFRSFVLWDADVKNFKSILGRK